MNKTLKQLLVLTLACVTLCGTTLAAPRGGKGRAPQPAKRHQIARLPAAPKHHATKRQNHQHKAHNHHTHHNTHHHHNVHHHHHGEHHTGWITLGAAVVGGVVGGLLGACQ
ncbi:MAG: hypothetical protein J6S51_05085 [Kiritimatiellae bacterium]|nr:hypothetical protein [Kiritimatiellia bacterium]